MKTFRRNLLFLALAALIISCVATKKQKDRFLSKHCERKDSVQTLIKNTVQKHDSIIYTSVPGPIQFLENPCKLLCDSLGNLIPFKIKEKKENGSRGTIFTVGNSIGFKCEIDSAAVAVSWYSYHDTKEVISHTENTVKKECELEHRTDFDGVTWYWFWVTASILVLWILFKIFKTWLKAYIPSLK